MKWNRQFCVVALTLGMATVPVLQLRAQPRPVMQDRDDQNRDQNRDWNRNDQGRDRDDHDRQDNQWSNNRYYQMGQRDADDDHRNNRRGRHDHNFNNDEDRRAYEAGYNANHGQEAK